MRKPGLSKTQKAKNAIGNKAASVAKTYGTKKGKGK